MRLLNRFKKFGLKLSPGKCKFFQTVKCLCHIVSKKGIETDPSKTATLKTWGSVVIIAGLSETIQRL